MTEQQKAYSVKLTSILSKRKHTNEEMVFIENAKIKTPKMFDWCLKMSQKVRKNVDNFLLDTWIQTINDERNYERNKL